MTDEEKAFREAFRGARGVPPVRPLDPQEIRALAGEDARPPTRWRRSSRWLAAAAAAVIVIGGGSVAWSVFGNGGAVRAVPAAPPPSATASPTASPTASTATDLLILGYSWLVTDLPGVKLRASDPDQTIAFRSDSEVDGRVGCSTYTAPYTLDGSRLRFGAMDMVPVPCPSRSAELIQPMVDALGNTRTATLVGNDLTFTSASGEVALTLRRMPLPSATPAGPTAGPTSGPTRTSAGGIFERTRALPDAPEAVRNPGVLHSCGQLELDHGGTPGAEALRCLTDQYSGVEGAELDVTVPTVEGDPIVYFFQHTTGPIRVYRTDHWDAWRGGSGDWTQGTCPTSSAVSWKSLWACAG